jgi:PAS domain S-box-containing protein
MSIRRIKISDMMYAFITLVIAVVYYWSAQLGFLFAWKHTNVSAVWPPSALGFIVIFSLGRRLWPGIWFGAFLANVSYFLSDPSYNLVHIILYSFPIATGNTLEALVASILLKKVIGTRNPLHKVQDLLRFMLFTLLGCIIAASIGSMTVCISEPSFWKSFSTIWLTWWMGDFSGILTIAPFFWILGQRSFTKVNFKHISEFFILFVMLFLVNGALFSGTTLVSQTHIPITHLPLALMVWITYRFGYWGAITSILLALIQDIPGTNNGVGPFITSDSNTSLLLLQTFLGTICGTTLLLAASLFERRQSQQEVVFSEQRFKALVENSSDMIALLNPLGVITYSSPSTEKIMGYGRQDHEGRNILEFVHPDEESHVMGEFSRVLRSPGEVITVFTRIRHKNGSWRWIESTGRNLLNDPAVRAVVVNYRDITERKEYEENKFYLASIIESSDEAIMGKTLDGRITSWNKGAKTLYGYTAEEVLGKPVDMLVPESKKHEEHDFVLQRIQEGQPIESLETQRLTKDGRILDVLLTVSPIKNEKGELIGASSIVRDITERKRIQEAIQENEERLSTIINSSLDAMVGINEEGVITFWNPQAEKIFGWTYDEVVNVRKMVDSIIPLQFRAAYEKGLMGENSLLNQRVELFGLHRNGREFPLEITVCASRWKGKKLFTAFLRDITDRKLVEDILKRDKVALEKLVEERSKALVQTQQELKQASRLADIGTLAAIIAHELRTPLGVIQMAVHNLKNKNKELVQNNHVSNIEKKVWEGNRIIDNLLTYSRIKPPAFESFPVLNLIDECVTNISQQFKEASVTVHKNYKVAPDFVIDIDPNQMREVFINVLNNSYQALHNKSGEIEISVEKKDEENAQITIRDTGSGIDPENLDKIFRPFFTTKAKGTGLGLAICNEVVNMHHGHLDLDSTLGQGTSIYIILPLKHRIPVQQ